MGNSTVVDVVTRKLIPYVLLFGFYLISNGHISPGGGFQGGVVLSSGVMLLCLSRGASEARRHFPPSIFSIILIAAFSLFLITGILGMIIENHFLAHMMFGSGREEAALVRYIFVLDLIIGLEVGAGMSLICFHFLKEE